MERDDARRVEIVENLFRAWSSADADAPEQYLTGDAILSDSIGGDYQGWPAIREYFQRGLEHYPDLELVPTGEYWFRDDGVALTWRMSATAQDDRYGPGTQGRRWNVEGMSYIVFDGDRIKLEVDYHDAGARGRSLQQTQT
jgi:SnoaL-like domain